MPPQQILGRLKSKELFSGVKRHRDTNVWSCYTYKCEALDSFVCEAFIFWWARLTQPPRARIRRSSTLRSETYSGLKCASRSLHVHVPKQEPASFWPPLLRPLSSLTPFPIHSHDHRHRHCHQPSSNHTNAQLPRTSSRDHVTLLPARGSPSSPSSPSPSPPPILSGAPRILRHL